MPGFEWVGNEELQALQQLFAQSKGNLYRYGPGGYAVADLEKRFAAYLGVKYAHCVSSGTAAVHSALAAAGVGPGDEVITTSFTFAAPVEAILNLGAVPVCVEIDDTYHLDPEAVLAATTSATKAVLAIPMWAPPHMDRLEEICRAKGLLLLEDAAQCLGGSFRGRKLGTFGALGSFSFDMGKSITTGEGGVIVTDDKELYDRAAEFSDHGHMHVPGLPRGQDPRRAPGLNYRMSELAGAVGLAQLAKLEDMLARQAATKKQVKQGLAGLPGVSFRAFSDEAGSLGDTLIFSLADREAAAGVAARLAQQGFGSKILPEAFEWHFAGAWDHIFRRLPGYEEGALAQRWPRTKALLERSVALPIWLRYDEAQAAELVEAVRQAVTG